MSVYAMVEGVQGYSEKVYQKSLFERYLTGTEEREAFRPFIGSIASRDHTKREVAILGGWLDGAVKDKHAVVVSITGPHYGIDPQTGKIAVMVGIPDSTERLVWTHAKFARYCRAASIQLDSIITLADQEALGIPEFHARMTQTQFALYNKAILDIQRVQVPMLTTLDETLWREANSQKLTLELKQWVVTSLIQQRRRYYLRIAGSTSVDRKVRFRVENDIREYAAVGYYVRRLFPQALVVTNGPEVLARCLKGLVPDLPLLILKHPRHC